jgi:uncharacterized protein (DUF58 family)
MNGTHDDDSALAALRTVQIVTQRLASLELSGAYRSTFRGQGLEFREVRAYQPGDDVRTIDWNVSARMNETFVKVFTEERELSVFVVLDTSRSLAFGTQRASKRRLGNEVTALLTMSVAGQGDRIGLIAGAQTVEHFVPPKKGKKHAFRLLSAASARSVGTRTRLDLLLDVLSARRRSVAFVVSDFFCPNIEKSLGRAAQRHDVVPVVLEDVRDGTLPDVGLIELEDFETGQTLSLDTSSRSVRERFKGAFDAQRSARAALFQRYALDAITVTTEGSFIEPFRKFFKQRAKRRRR